MGGASLSQPSENRPTARMVDNPRGIPAADRLRNPMEHVDVSPMGTEGCLWDEDHYVWEEPEDSPPKEPSGGSP